MFRKSRSGFFCLSLVVALFVAFPWGRRIHLKSSTSVRLQEDSGNSKSAGNFLKSNKGIVRSGASEYAKRVTTDPLLKYPPPSGESQPGVEKGRKQGVLELIHYPWEDLGFSIVFLGSRPGYRAMTLTARHRIEVYVRPREGLMLQAYDLAHELGHAFDLKNNNEERRRKWLALRGIKPSTPWFGCDACPDYGTPAGDFAETFAYLLLGPGNFHSIMAPAPTADQVPELAAFCQIEPLSEALTIPVPKANKAAGIPQRERLPEIQNSPGSEPISRENSLGSQFLQDYGSVSDAR